MPQADAVSRKLGIILKYSPQIALGRVGIHPQQQIGRGQIENAQRMRLYNLRHVENTAQLFGSGRNTNGQQRVADLRRCRQVAYRTDAADARHNRWHFVKRTTLAQLFEAADLRYVEVRIRNVPPLIEVNCDFPVPFDASDGFDDYHFLAHVHPRVNVTSESGSLASLSGSKSRFGAHIGATSLKNVRQHRINGVRGRRAARHVNINFDEFVDGASLGQ